jgi:hypothetical protein
MNTAGKIIIATYIISIIAFTVLWIKDMINYPHGD